ncbi:hypothetical protein [Cohnella nanjingensis]|uniref:Uncharacterized protein n=1 Tax=Cohnella nanjingensis TaxID=1387779 RepID=A0A7X0RSE2_9BACL|nr:hypothetical protein [Cohnella nanjingensis]MBB6672628.1 hypothetical protein [Cohnella nanjingensis]
MPVPTFAGLPPFPEFDDVVNKVNQLVNQLRNLLLNLDTLNIVELNADVINSGTVNAGKVTVKSDLNAGAYILIDGNGMTINDGSKNTFQVNINGQVTMTSATIQSSTGYPKVVMNPNGTLFGAYKDASNFVSVDPQFAGAPGYVLYSGGNPVGVLHSITNGIELFGSGNLQLQGPNGINLITLGPPVTIQDWSYLQNVATGKTLADDMATKGISTGPSGGHNHGIPDGTVLLTSGGGSVTYFAAPNHTHAQK